MMITELEHIFHSFLGDANHTQCFDHVVAIVTKSAVRQFDLPKDLVDGALDDAEKALRELAEGIDIEGEEAKSMWESEGDDDKDDKEEDIDQIASLGTANHAELENNIRPVRLVLVKVSNSQPSSCHCGIESSESWTCQNTGYCAM
jgi:hypothetical protein